MGYVQCHHKYTRVNHQGRKQTVPGFYASGGLCSIAAQHVFFLLTKLQSLVVKLYNHKFLYRPIYSIMGEASIRYGKYRDFG